MKERALVFGIGGQDGSYLAEHLVGDGYEVHGVHRRTSTGNLGRLERIEGSYVLHRGDLCDPISVHRVLTAVRPDLVFNEADQDHVGWSFSTPGYNFDVTGAAVGRLLEAVAEIVPDAKVFQPLSATMFGHNEKACNEETRLVPSSPYACAKVFAYALCKYYREYEGLKVSTAILFNHDSNRRGGEYLLHKICSTVVKQKNGDREPLRLSCLDQIVDIGHAEDYTRAIIQIAKLEEQTDFVIGNPYRLSIQELALEAYDQIGGTPNIEEGTEFASVNLVSDTKKAKEAFGWDGGEWPLEDLINDLLQKYGAKL